VLTEPSAYAAFATSSRALGAIPAMPIRLLVSAAISPATNVP